MGAEKFGSWTWVCRSEGFPAAIWLPAKRSGGVSSYHWRPALHTPASLVLRLAGFSVFDWWLQIRDELIRT